MNHKGSAAGESSFSPRPGTEGEGVPSRLPSGEAGEAAVRSMAAAAPPPQRTPRPVRFSGAAARGAEATAEAGGGSFRRARGLPAPRLAPPLPPPSPLSPPLPSLRRSLPLGASILVLGSLHPGFSSARTQNRK